MTFKAMILKTLLIAAWVLPATIFHFSNGCVFAGVILIWAASSGIAYKKKQRL